MQLLTVDEYFAGYKGSLAITATHRANAVVLVNRTNHFLRELLSFGDCDLDINPKTKSIISGWKNGGWRPKDCPEGAEKSSHKEGKGIDIYDPDGDLDSACTDDLLAKHGLYREHPSQTKGWMHLTTRAPRSGKRTFYA